MNNDISFERVRRIRKILGKRSDTRQKSNKTFEKVKDKLLDDIKLEIE